MLDNPSGSSSGSAVIEKEVQGELFKKVWDVRPYKYTVKRYKISKAKIINMVEIIHSH